MRPILRLLPAFVLLTPLLALAVPSTLTYQGRLFTPTGQPRTGTPTIVFKLYSTVAGTASVWSETVENVPLTNGFYSLSLGQNGTSALESVVAANDGLWMELTVDGTTLAPRQPLTMMPSALKAKSLKGGSVEATSVKVAGKPIVLNVAGKVPDDQSGNVSLSPADVGLPTCATHGQTLNSKGLGEFECAADVDGQSLSLSGSSLSISNGNSVSLPVATSSTLGLVKVGSGLSVDANGIVSSLPVVSLSGSILTINGTAINLAKAYASACPAGYNVFEKAICENVNECLTNNGGCDANADCTDTVGSWTCACKAGYSGNGLSCTASIVPKKVAVFTSSGTWKKPSGHNRAKLYVLGGGGGGGAGGQFTCLSGGGGGGGGGGAPGVYRMLYVGLDGVGDSVPVIVGTGGDGGTGLRQNGVRGGTSSFGVSGSSLWVYAGGGGGGGGAVASSGSGGSVAAPSGVAGTSGASWPSDPYDSYQTSWAGGGNGGAEYGMPTPSSTNQGPGGGGGGGSHQICEDPGTSGSVSQMAATLHASFSTYVNGIRAAMANGGIGNYTTAKADNGSSGQSTPFYISNYGNVAGCYFATGGGGGGGNGLGPGGDGGSAPANSGAGGGGGGVAGWGGNATVGKGGNGGSGWVVIESWAE